MGTTEHTSPDEVKSTSTKAVTLRLNPWWLSAVLALALLMVVVLWKPWSRTHLATDRTVSVSGSATLKAEPDEYVFYPSYEFKNADKAAGLKDLTEKSDAVVAGLKKAGVADKDIKTNASGYRDYYFYNEEDRTHTYSLQVTVTTRTRDAAQKAQDYILTTSPSGSVTPQPTFSAAKQKELETKGRDQASKDARGKAEQQAINLGFRLGAVKTVQDSNGGYGYPMPLAATMDASRSSVASAPSMAIQPGENELTYTVQVTYYIR